MSLADINYVRKQINDLIVGYEVRYFRWTDADLKGSGNVVCFRTDTSLGGDFLERRTLVGIQMLTDPRRVTDGFQVMQNIIDRIYQIPYSWWVDHFQPMSDVIGPTYLANDRARFECQIRVDRMRENAPAMSGTTVWRDDPATWNEQGTEWNG